jgi:hypothetical protein
MGRRGDAVTPELIDDAEAMANDGSVAGRYTATLAREGVSALIANATSRPMLLRLGEHSLPVTVDDGGYGRSYVASPHSAYVLYAREEMDLVGMKRGRLAARAALGVLDGLLRAARINRAVHLDNWLLSTNLHGDWDGSGLAAARALLSQRFPDHFLILRSLDAWSCPKLLEAARADGWILAPSRQVWVVDDPARDWRPRNHTTNDRRALARSALRVEDLKTVDASDAARIAELYDLLYVGRYSALNPVFTPRFIQAAQALGMLHHRVARDSAGRIMAAAGMLARNGVMTPPVVGYDTSRPQAEALYRIASYLYGDWAETQGLALHGSAGAGDFKRNRGARGVIEYMAIHAGHLGAGRREAVRRLAQALERFAVPMMQREGW